MSNRERAARLLNLIDDDKMIFIVRILESVVEFAEMSEVPNEITAAAIKEGDAMLENGTGERYSSVDELFRDLDKSRFKRPLGIADGKFKIPDNLDRHNDEIAVMFGVN